MSKINVDEEQLFYLNEKSCFWSDMQIDHCSYMC